MTTLIQMPKIAMAMNEGTITQWLKADGEPITKGDILFEVETEKTAYEVEATASGTLKIIVDAGQTVKVETVVGELVSEQAVESAKDESPATKSAEESVMPEPRSEAKTISNSDATRIKASPLAKKIAAAENIDLSLVEPTGAHGRIKKRDIETYKKNRGHSAHHKGDGVKKLPLTPMRRKISEGVMQAINQQAMTPNAIEVNMERLIETRDHFVARQEEFGVKVSYQAFFIKALALAARDVPIVNSRMAEDCVEVFEAVNVSFAVALQDSEPAFSGLVMPVIKNADGRGIVDIQNQMAALIEKARARKLTSDDLASGTITLSSTAGMVRDYMISTPLLNQGQSFIGQPGNIVDRPVVRNGELVAGKVMSFCFTFDHRVMDGVPACAAASRFKEYLEAPELMLR